MQLDTEKSGAATKKSVHIILFLPDTMFSIYRSDCSANQTRGQFWIKTNLEKKKRQALILMHFTCSLMYAGTSTR